MSSACHMWFIIIAAIAIQTTIAQRQKHPNRPFSNLCKNHVNCTGCRPFENTISCDNCIGINCKGKNPNFNVHCEHCELCKDGVCFSCDFCPDGSIPSDCGKYDECSDCKGGKCTTCARGYVCGNPLDLIHRGCGPCTDCSTTVPFRCDKCPGCISEFVDCNVYRSCNDTDEKGQQAKCEGDVMCLKNLISVEWVDPIKLFFDNSTQAQNSPNTTITDHSSCRVNSWMSYIQFNSIPDYRIFGLCTAGTEKRGVDYFQNHVFFTNRRVSNIRQTVERHHCKSDMVGVPSFIRGVRFKFGAEKGRQFISSVDVQCSGTESNVWKTTSSSNDKGLKREELHCPAQTAICTLTSYVQNFGDSSNRAYKMINFMIGCCHIPKSMYYSGITYRTVAHPAISTRWRHEDIRPDSILTFNPKTAAGCAKDVISESLIGAVDYINCSKLEDLKLLPSGCEVKLAYKGRFALDIRNCKSGRDPQRDCTDVVGVNRTTTRPSYSACTPITKFCPANQFITSVDISRLSADNYVGNATFFYRTLVTGFKRELVITKFDFKCSDYRNPLITPVSISGDLYGGLKNVRVTFNATNTACSANHYGTGFTSGELMQRQCEEFTRCEIATI